MAHYALWLDHDHAKIFKFSPSNVALTELKKSGAQHHTNHTENEKHQHTEKFLHEVAEKVKDAEVLLVMGPGIAKNHFKTHLEKHHHQKTAEKIIGIENTDSHISDKQIEQKAREYFTKYNVFH